VSVFLDTRGNASLAIGICGRCSRKLPIGELHPDPNYPGLLVCRADQDQFDPYRLPARQPETIALRYARPDTPLYEGGPSTVPAPEPVEIHPFTLVGDE
jgi:hypothetical protein